MAFRYQRVRCVPPRMLLGRSLTMPPHLCLTMSAIGQVRVDEVHGNAQIIPPRRAPLLT